MTYARPLIAIVAAGSLLATGPLALAAGSAATPKGGAIRIFVTNTSMTKGKITITGAIGDYGTTVSEDKNGKVDANGAYEKVALKQGGFIVDGTALNKVLDHANPQINPSNCSLAFTGTGPVTIGSGTGAYAGISGTASITVTFAGVSPKQGAKCNENTEPSGLYQSITGVGKVSFSS